MAGSRSSVVAYSWEYANRQSRLDNPLSNLSVHVLPDASGFIGFETNRWEPERTIAVTAVPAYACATFNSMRSSYVVHSHGGSVVRNPSVHERVGRSKSDASRLVGVFHVRHSHEADGLYHARHGQGPDSARQGSADAQ